MYAGTVIASWAARYINRKEDELPETQHRVVLQAVGELFADIKIGKFRLATDVGKSEGGKGLAPSPIDLLLAAVGGQIEINLQRFAKSEKMALEGIRVHLEMEEGEPKPKVSGLVEVWGKLNQEHIRTLEKEVDGISFQWLNLPVEMKMKAVDG